MSYAQILSIDTKYNLSRIVNVEVDTSRGFHAFNLVGLAHKSINEAKDRVSAAIKNCGYISPKQRNQKIVVSLAPAHIHKEGTHFDLAIALGYLKAIKEIPGYKLDQTVFVGELGLNGEIRPIKHILSAVKLATKQNLQLVIPEENVKELQHLSNPNILSARHISEVIAWARGKSKLNIVTKPIKSPLVDTRNELLRFENMTGSANLPVEIQGNTKSKIALALSVVGNHHMCLYGPAGTGKTSLVNWLKHLIPPITDKDILEVSEIKEYFTEEYVGGSSFNNLRPFRSPHHNVTLSKFIGGGNPIKAGEVTLAHKGILFMDEFVEFKSEVINSLREPLENKCIVVHTGPKTISLPTEFTLVCATNLCNCGNYGSIIKRCYCDERLRRKYLARIPGPIIDRIPIWSLADESTNNDSFSKNISFSDIKNQIDKGLSFKDRRLKNSKIKRIDSKVEQLDGITKRFMDIKAAELNLSGRQIFNYTKLARTFADLSEECMISRTHIDEALKYMPNIKAR